MNTETVFVGKSELRETESSRLVKQLVDKVRDLEHNRAIIAERGNIGWHDDPSEMEFHGEIVTIGERLNELGGWSAMIRACEFVEDEVGFMGGVVLNYAWDGIGRWSA